MIAPLILAARLTAAIAGPDVPMDRAAAAALPIVLLSDDNRVELVAAIAYHESRFQHDAISPDRRDCGIMGVRSRPARCRAIRASAWAGVAAGVAKLQDARAFAARRRAEPGELDVLAGYASGPRGVRHRWYRAPRRVLATAAQIRARMGVDQ